MFSKKKNSIFIFKLSITIACWAIVMLLLLPGCSGKKNEFGEAVMERDSLPSMITYGVNSLISDSGVIRYKIIAEEWLVYDKKNPPYWAFEAGVYLEKFDSLFQVDAFIKADTAYFFEKKKLWELRSNVFINTTEGDQVETDLLFWDQNKEKLYSNQYARIEQKGNIIDANYGFESNQQLTEYKIFNSQGIFLFDETPKDSLRTNPTLSTTDSIMIDSIPNRQ